MKGGDRISYDTVNKQTHTTALITNSKVHDMYYYVPFNMKPYIQMNINFIQNVVTRDQHLTCRMAFDPLAFQVYRMHLIC